LIGIGIATSRKVARVEGRGRPSLKSISNSLHLRLMKEQECLYQIQFQLRLDNKAFELNYIEIHENKVQF